MWGLLTAVVALILLLPSSDSLSNLQNVTIVATSPFIVIMIGLMVSTLMDMRKDLIYQDYQDQQMFATKLARERRAVRDHQRREELAARHEQRMKEKAARKDRAPKR